MSLFNIILRIILYIVGVSFTVEYLINRQSNTLLFLLALAIIAVLSIVLILPLIKKLLRS
jgi:hypothetical protein